MEKQSQKLNLLQKFNKIIRLDNLNLMSYNYNKLLETGIFTDESKALDFIANADLLQNGCFCSDDCAGFLEFRKKASFKYGYCLYCPWCKKRYSVLYDSFFTRSKLPIHQILQIIYHWAMLDGVAETAFEVGVSCVTITNFFEALRDACEDWYDLHHSKNIGGQGTIVEVDETIMVKRKSNAGRMLPAVWVVGGICRQTNQCFAKMVPNRTATTLEDVIQEYVKPNTTIHTDMWSGYTNIATKGYIHKTVNHSKNFVNPVDGTHTQKIERFWRGLKDVRRRYQGIPKSEIDSHIYEYLWRKTRSVTKENAFEEAIHMLSDVRWS